MIHTKSLIRRLAYVPWLLALGLVVGWTGTAEAVGITLTLDKSSVREDAGTTEITVTAKSDGTTDGPIHVILSYEATADPLNQRFRMVVPTIVIPAGEEKSGSGPISFIPVNDNFRGVHGDYQDNGAADDLVITIDGAAGTGNTVTETTLTMIDDDKLTRNLKLMFDPMPVSREAEGTDVEVTLYVDGSRFASRHSFDIVYKNTVGDARNDLFDQTPNTRQVILDLLDANNDGTVDRTEDVLVRDSQYRADTDRINLGRRKREASATITFDPFNFPGYAAIEAALRAPDSRSRFLALSDPTGANVGYPEDNDDSSWLTRVADPTTTPQTPPRSGYFDGNLDPDGDGTNNFHTPGQATVSDDVDERRYHLIRANKPARKDDKFASNFDATAIAATPDRIVDNVRNFLEVRGIDLNSDGDTGDVIPLTYGLLTEANLDLDFDGDGEKTGCVSEVDLGIDLDGDGLLTVAGCMTDGSNTLPDPLVVAPALFPAGITPLLYNPNTSGFTSTDPTDDAYVGLIDTLTSLQEKNMPFGVMLRTGFFQVKDETAPIVKAVTIKSESCAGSMREDAVGEQTFTVEVELARERPEESLLRFEIEDETEANREDSDCEDCAGIRDIDYKADILPLRIPPKTKRGLRRSQLPPQTTRTRMATRFSC